MIVKKEPAKKPDDSFLKTTKRLSALVVEDEESTSYLIAKLLERYFDKVYLARNGQEGLETFLNKKIDIIITDNNMPVVSGVEMICKIKRIDYNVPVVLMTAGTDPSDLITCINANVTHFIRKPIEKDELLRAIKKCVSEVIVKDIELEMLKDKEKSHAVEEEMAFKKQMNLIKNDYAYKYLQDGDKRLVFRVYYNPLDYMSGDVYSLRKLDDEKVFIYIMDGMGKGLSASITSILSCAYLNDLFEKHKNNFELENIIKDYFELIKNKILDEEIVSILFAQIDAKNKDLTYAIYGMPPVLLVEDGEVVKLKSNNMPMSKHLLTLKISQKSLKSVQKMLFYSDGVNEAPTKDGGIYAQNLEKDFKDFLCSRHIYNRFLEARESQEDDTTLIYVNILDPKDDEILEFESSSNISQIEGLAAKIERELVIFGLDDTFVSQFSNALFEIIMNAYEHGNLGIGFDEKQKLLSKGIYEEELLKRETHNLYKKIKVSIYNKLSDKQGCLMIFVEDEGDGFDVNMIENIKKIKTRFHARGIVIAQKMVDAILYNEKGNIAFLVKTYLKD